MDLQPMLEVYMTKPDITHSSGDEHSCFQPTFPSIFFVERFGSANCPFLERPVRENRFERSAGDLKLSIGLYAFFLSCCSKLRFIITAISAPQIFEDEQRTGLRRHQGLPRVVRPAAYG